MGYIKGCVSGERVTSLLKNMPLRVTLRVLPCSRINPTDLKLLRILLMTGLTSALIAGCVAVPPRPSLLGSHGMQFEGFETCARNPSISNGESGLNPAGFSVASWNIYKEQLNGWAIDADQLSQ